MSDSPLRTAVQAIDRLDLDALVACFAPAVQLTILFGQEAAGRDEARAVLGDFFAGLRATRHELTDEWHPEPGVWIAELSATYELTDFSERGPYRRAIILRAGADGIELLHIYGAHELPLSEDGHIYQEVRGPHGWLPTL
jgi:SnoaL-like domain